MLKDADPLKNAEALAVEALRRLLEKVPIIEIEGIECGADSPDWTPDVIARLLVDGRRYTLACEFKSNGQPRVEDTQALGERTPQQWQQDAFGQIDALLRAMALRQ